MGHAYCRDISGDWPIGPDDTVADGAHRLQARQASTGMAFEHL